MLKKAALALALLLVCASPSWATNYFISPSGSDGANGLSTGTAWLTPNHALNCGDVITAAASSSYSAANFNSGDWGTVTCPSSNDVAWLKCATFDACKITSTSLDGIRVDKSYWGVVGWEVTTTTAQGIGCFVATSDTSGVTAHHIIFANNVANGCMGGGFTTYNLNSTTSVDYIVIVGNIAYNAAQGNTHCFSAISIYQPAASDSNAGTHMYVAGNFAYDTLEPATCNTTPSTDGEAVIFDTFDGDQLPMAAAYVQQGVIQNNLGMLNGGMGFEVLNNTTGGTSATVYVKYNTAYGNNTDPNQTGGCLGHSEMAPRYTKNTTYDHNLAQTKTGTGCSSAAIYGSFVETVNGTDTVPTGWYYSAAGHPTGSDNATGFSFGTITTTNPVFANPVDPGAPSCGSFSSTVACMATPIANFTPTTGGATAFGYQPVSNTSVVDSLFPAWLCTATGVLNANIPAGLITPGCGFAAGGGNVSGQLTGGMMSFVSEDKSK